MTTEFLVPVLDILEGNVVWAQAGERDNYLPIESKLSDSTHPIDLAIAIQHAIGAETFYLADLDSLVHGQPPNLGVIERLLQEGFSLWVDADWAGMESGHIQKLEARFSVPAAKSTPLRPILSSESLDGFTALEAEFERWKKWNPIFSFDLKNGYPIWNGVMPKAQDESERSPHQINEALKLAQQIGFSTAIVLDVGFVGTGVPRVGKHLDQIEVPAGLELISGGGVNDDTDVHTFLEAGCNRVLVCTALHRGVW